MILPVHSHQFKQKTSESRFQIESCGQCVKLRTFGFFENFEECIRRSITTIKHFPKTPINQSAIVMTRHSTRSNTKKATTPSIEIVTPAAEVVTTSAGSTSKRRRIASRLHQITNLKLRMLIFNPNHH
ncbi:unnamed protein product [Ambrosiozyma monospora]|uniref:Unnamed protein product n=1 Tax=Ambrosiozyma monospora TaxID=43982 RepID=A0A9W6YVW9_AMBMO|nr:unnamed protein product [Ambrosiozyma monospora]